MVEKPRRYSRPGRNGGRDWYLVSGHGSIIFYIAANPDATVRDLAEHLLSLTHGTVWGIIGDLRRADMLCVRKSGRRRHYSVNLEAPFHHPTIKGYRLGDVVGRLVEWARRDHPR